MNHEINEAKCYLLSYPPPNWGTEWLGANFKSRVVKKPRSPRKALREWISLADAITAAGGEVLVMPPPSETERNGTYLGSLCNMANAGELFTRNRKTRFLLARMNPEEAPHRKHEWRYVQQFIKKLGIGTRRAEFPWEGQADVLRIVPETVVATYGTTPGVRSSQASLLTVRNRFPDETEIIAVELAYPFFHGDTALACYALPKSGGKVFLYCPAAIASGEDALLSALRRSNAKIYRISEAEGRTYTANTLQVGETLIMNREVPYEIRGLLMEEGFRIIVIDLDELFGKAGGGPRCLTNILRFAEPQKFDNGILYRNCRADILRLVQTYPS